MPSFGRLHPTPLEGEFESRSTGSEIGSEVAPSCSCFHERVTDHLIAAGGYTVRWSRTPICRWAKVGRSEESADLAAYPLSDRTSYMTGSAIRLDGGTCGVSEVCITCDLRRWSRVRQHGYPYGRKASCQAHGPARLVTDTAAEPPSAGTLARGRRRG